MGFLPWYQLVGAGSPKAYKALLCVLPASLNCAKILRLTTHTRKVWTGLSQGHILSTDGVADLRYRVCLKPLNLQY
jgi:hypothetical protein